eukprot:283087_1
MHSLQGALSFSPELWRGLMENATFFDSNWAPQEDYQEYHFEIQILRGDTEQFDLISPASVSKLKELIRKEIVPRSKLVIPLIEFSWSIHFVLGRNKLVCLESTQQLRELINNTKKPRYPLRVLFNNETEYNMWAATEQRKKIPIIDNIEVVMTNGKLKVNIINFEEYRYNYYIQYQVQKVPDKITANKNSKSKSMKYAIHSLKTEKYNFVSKEQNKSPFIIDNLWPFETYRLRVRYQKIVFKNFNSAAKWSKWCQEYHVLPAPLNLYTCNKDKQKLFKSTIECYNHKQLCDWITLKLFGNEINDSKVLITPTANDNEEKENKKENEQRRETLIKLRNQKIWATSHERTHVFPIILKIIKLSKLKGTDLILKDPTVYVRKKLIKIYRENKLENNDDDDDDDVDDDDDEEEDNKQEEK